LIIGKNARRENNDRVYKLIYNNRSRMYNIETGIVLNKHPRTHAHVHTRTHARCQALYINECGLMYVLYCFLL